MKNFSSLVLLFLASGFTVGEYFLLKLGFSLYPEIHALTAYFWGFWGATFILFALLCFSKTHRNLVISNFSNYWKWAFLLSFSLLSMGVLWFYAIGNAPAGIVAFLENLTVPFSFFLGIIFLKEKFTHIQFFSLFVSGVGFFLMFNLKENISIIPLLSIVGMAFIFTLQSFVVKKYMQNFEFISFIYIRNIMTTFLAVSVLYFSGYIKIIPLGAILLFTISTFLGFFIARIFYFEAHKHSSLGTIHFFGLIEPVAVLFLSVLFLREEISFQKIYAAAIVLIGLFLFFRAEVEKKN